MDPNTSAFVKNYGQLDSFLDFYDKNCDELVTYHKNDGDYKGNVCDTSNNE
jgi:hypothetical protein